ncbi:MAG: glycine/betaine ABC transporter substrate-binding protein [Acidobacteria bacterium 13_1_40CM_3_65_5]|nr:MAG: glycine/betaine ABC transporter substrate-binding protein [Acidobacteria bacterium 13_1_40CM_3_65_5]OLE78336.1 MAG: glycine/betaine ABC transporter substrate-binding protein [Acidobacteria bacterium 13_1_20CM_2_65_9]
MGKLIEFWWSHRAELAALLGQHVLLVAASTLVAVAVAVPLGVFASRRARLAAPILGVANIVQTVPSLAMFGFLLPVPFIGGVGARAALVVLILYGLLPIVRTTIAGLRGIDPSIREAGVAMGMTPRELLRQVELPLALPSIVAGVRVAAVVGVGSATIAAAIGAGGLGEYIYRGLSMVDTTVILAGAIPAALLALVVDGSLLWLERQLSSRRRSRSPRTVISAAAVLAVLVLFSSGVAARRATGAVVVASKNFTEQLVLGELLAQTIEREGIPVARRLNLGGTLICDRALLTGDADVYVEYTGTALTAIFHQPIHADSKTVFASVRDLYARTGRALLPPLGFNNTFAILVRGDEARSKGLRTIDDAARESPGWRAGFGYEFVGRPDGYPGLAKTYDLRFPSPPRVMDLTLTYRALAARQVDVIAGDATAGLIKGLDLVQLEDNRHYFPPYDAAPVARAETLLRYPAMRVALERLSGRISADLMRTMNYAADVEHRDIAQIVRDFLATWR